MWFIYGLWGDVKHARIAQSVERQPLKLVVVGSSPTSGSLDSFFFAFIAWHGIALHWQCMSVPRADAMNGAMMQCCAVDCTLW